MDNYVDKALGFFKLRGPSDTKLYRYEYYSIALFQFYYRNISLSNQVQLAPKSKCGNKQVRLVGSSLSLRFLLKRSKMKFSMWVKIYTPCHIKTITEV